MFHITTQAPPVSAITIIHETAGERTARHLGQCQRLAELAMMLAEAAAARAQMAFAQLPPGPEQRNEPAPRLPRAPHPATLFAHLSSAVRQAIKLETRIVAGHAATLGAHTQADPRRAKIRRAIRQATHGRPDRAILREQADEMLETELALDPDGTTSLPDLLETICEDLGFKLDFDQLAADLATRDLAFIASADLQDDPDKPPGPPH